MELIPPWRPMYNKIEPNLKEKWCNEALPHWRVDKLALNPLCPNSPDLFMEWDNSLIENASWPNDLLQFLTTFSMWSEIPHVKGSNIKGWFSLVRVVVWDFEHLLDVLCWSSKCPRVFLKSPGMVLDVCSSTVSYCPFCSHLTETYCLRLYVFPTHLICHYVSPKCNSEVRYIYIITIYFIH